MSEIVLRMLGSAVLVIVVMLVFYVLEKRTRLGNWRCGCRQLLPGVLFACLTMVLLQLGFKVGGALDNIQDVVPLCAALVFGVPVGMIAGVLGAVLAFFSGIGVFTTVSIVVSLVLAGILGSVLRCFLFDNKVASEFYGLAAGLIMAVFHMLILLMMHLDNLKDVYVAIHTLAVPLMLVSAFTSMMILRLVAFCSGEKRVNPYHSRGIADIFQRWLLLCVVAAFTITCLYSWQLQTSLAETAAKNLLRLNIEDVQKDISETSNTDLLKIARRVALQITPACFENEHPGEVFYNSRLNSLMSEFCLTEINLIDNNGVNVASTDGTFCGYNMANGTQSAAFLVLMHGTPELVQDYQAISSDASISRKYAGAALPEGGFVQVGYGAEQFQTSMRDVVSGFTNYVHIGESGGVLIIDADGLVVSDNGGAVGQTVQEIGLNLPNDLSSGNTFNMVVHGRPSLCMYDSAEGYQIVAYYPVEEAMLYRNAGGYSIVFMEIILFAVIFLLIYFLVKRLVVDNIHTINQDLARISNGNLNTRVDVHTNEEFTSLSQDINTTVDTLKHYIAEAAARIDQELEFARTIQLSLLPTDFPVHPALDLFASMNAAREVGGDFYDFYWLSETRLALLVADVSGKGIPAAMFMMRSKTLLKSLMENGLTPSEAFAQANAELVENNEACMFVTAWMGVLDLSTGHVDYVNAGHNPPMLRTADGVSYLRSKADMVLGGMEGSSYRMQQLQLVPEEILFLYTDGLTEAMNQENHLYGKERPLAVLRTSYEDAARIVVEKMQVDVERYVGSAEQSDDITMLVLHYHGNPEEKKE